VSKVVTPKSIALRTKAAALRASMRPQNNPPISQQPKHNAETVTPVRPSGRYSIPFAPFSLKLYARRTQKQFLIAEKADERPSPINVNATKR
jgi:hypothetical protein